MNNNFIDIHSHILYGIDDGSRDINESINMIKKMKDLGFNDIIITPHYIDGTSYQADNKKKIELLNIIKSKLDFDINLYLGNEIFIFDDIDKYIKDNKISSLNNSKYILIEVPFVQEIVDLDKYVYKLIKAGYKVILVHPERYTFIQSNPDNIIKYLDMGVLLQCNYQSITGRYGHHAKKTIKYLLKHKYVSFLGSDIHRENSSFYDNFGKIKKKILHITNEDYFKDITYNNILKVITNEDI